MKKTLYLLILLFCLIFDDNIFSQDKSYKWDRLSGKWSITNSRASETQGNSLTWKYYETLEYNSILSKNIFSSLDSIELVSQFFDRIDSPSEIMFSFAITSEDRQWYYHMYAFKLTGGFWGMNKASFIYSDRLDKTKPMNTKNNTFVRELASADCKVKYDKMYNYRIAFEGSDVVLYINNERVLAAPFPEKSHDGRIAISARNVKIAVDKVEVRQGEKVIFEDDFNEDSIYVRVLKVTKEPAPKEGNDKKPE